MIIHTSAHSYRLFRRLAATLGISMIVTGLVSLGLNYQYVRTHFRQEEEEEIASITRSLRLTIENYADASNPADLDQRSASVLDHSNAKVKLQNFLHTYTELPDVISATVVAPDGRIIAHDSHADDSAPEARTKAHGSVTVAPELALAFQRLASSNTEHYIELTLNGEPVLAHAVPLDTTMFATTATKSHGWLVVVLKLDEMDEQIRLFLLRSLAIHLVTIVGLIGILSWVAQRVLLKPLQQLNQAIQASKDSGIFLLPSSMPNNEIGFLARTLDAALQARQQAERSLHQQTERLQQQNYILNQLAKDPALYVDYRSAVKGLTEATVKTLDVERASVWLYTDDRSQLECIDLFERTPHRHSAGVVLAVADYPQYCRALEETELAIAAYDAHHDPRTSEFSENYLTPLGITSMLDSPIRSGGQTIGVLCIEQVGAPRQWSLEDEQFARAITDLTALALETCDRHHAESALRQSELTNRALLRAIPDLLIHMRRDGTYLSVQRSEHVHLYNPNHDYVGSNIYEILPPEYAYQRMRYVHLALQTGQPQVYSYAIEVGGNLRYEEARVIPCGEDDVLIIVRDVSERHQAEQQIRRQSARLEATLEELRQTQAQIIQTEKMSSLGQLVAGIAHEINNPVNFIYGNLVYACDYVRGLIQVLNRYRQQYPCPGDDLETLMADVDVDFILEDLPNMLKSMQGGAERIRQLVLTLRNYSRLDEAEMKIVDLHEGIDSTLIILQHHLKAAHRDVHGEMHHGGIQVVKQYGNLPMVECYAGQLNQVFTNVIGNAIDALQERDSQRSAAEIAADPGTITITTEVLSHGWVRISVQDNGPGIPEQHLSRLFDPFFTTKPVGRGTGLGLSISYKIVTEKHGGQLRCLSEVGRGTTFQIDIPTHQNTHCNISKRS